MTTFTSAYRQLQATERAFVDAYTGQAQIAAQRSGEHITLALYRPIPADVVDASRGMLTRPLVLAAIHERINELGADTELSINRVARELVAIAFSNMQDYTKVDDFGMPTVSFEDLTREQWAAVESVDIEMQAMTPNAVKKKKVKLYSKIEAIKLLIALYDPAQVHLREAANSSQERKRTALPATATVDNAADAYGALVNG